VIVIDASAMVDALVGTAVNAQLMTLIAQQDVHSPALLDFEVASALRGHALAGRLRTKALNAAMADFAALTIERHAMTDLLPNMLDLRKNFTVYDAYVVLAKALRSPLVTADSKMSEANLLGVEVMVLRPQRS